MDALQVVIEPRRREILRLVWDRELSAGDIASAFDVTFGAVSQHLGVLRNAGFVRVRSDGNRRYYQADRERLGPLAKALEAMWAATLDQLADTIEADLAAERKRGGQPKREKR
jgi:DNA-binding transcriptional ArsR family regulator